MTRYTASIVFLLFAFTASAQNVAFLGIDPDPRSTSMGGPGIALPGSTYAIFSNMAAAAYGQGKIEAAYSYTPWMRDIVKGSNLNAAAAYVRFAGRHTLGAGFRNFTDGEYRQYGETGDMGLFRPHHLSAEIGYAYAVNGSVSVSATLRFVGSEVSDMPDYKKSDAVAADIGFAYKRGSFAAAFAVSNLGSRIDYGQGGEGDMPMWIRAGASYGIEPAEGHLFTGSLGLSYQIHEGNDGILGSVGAEYTYKKRYSLRGGFRFGDEKKTSPCYGSVGAGMAFAFRRGFVKGFRLDVAYLITDKDSPLKNTFQAGCAFVF